MKHENKEDTINWEEMEIRLHEYKPITETIAEEIHQLFWLLKKQ